VLNDRTLLVTGDRDGTVRLWDACTQRRLATLAAFAHPVHAVTAVAIGGRLHVFGQVVSGRVIAWRADVPLLLSRAGL
jgi:WD40 repeat protein